MNMDLMGSIAIFLNSFGDVLRAGLIVWLTLRVISYRKRLDNLEKSYGSVADSPGDHPRRLINNTED